MLVDPDGREPYLSGTSSKFGSEQEDGTDPDPPKASEGIYFAEVFFRGNIPLVGPVGATGSISVGVLVSYDTEKGSITGYGIYGKLSLGGALGTGGARAGISSGPGHGNLDSFEGWGGNVGLVGAKWLGGGFEFSVPKEWQDADGNLLFDVGGTLSGNKSLNKDAGVGYFGYVDVSKTGYFKRADNIGEMIDWLQGDGAKNSFPNLPQLGPRFIKGLTESILNIESQVNNLLTNGTGPRP